MTDRRHRFLDARAAEAAGAAGWVTGTALVNRTSLLLSRYRLNAAITRQNLRAGRHRLDFAWPEHRLALLVEPPGWRRDDGTAAIHARCDAELRDLGWVILRVAATGTAEQYARQVARAARIVHAELGTNQQRIKLARTGGGRAHGNLAPGGRR